MNERCTDCIMAKKMARASHILVRAKADAVNIHGNIKKLKDFKKYAQRMSTCPSSRKGGDLGTFKQGDMVKEFDEAVWQLPLNEVSDPIKTAFGYHLIWVHERDE
ncbi:MAG TPA: peptidylprolyl isomerase [Candidatus Poseidoniales archaeon]|jgi:peptidyl-prolyl cis-trans isomerase C|nr:MAG: peptidylprolyl isomerase [Euryarchaeota archaeon]HIG03858.1 peptidylprolyl isomerase [Candidatus Poseidoniales archaeon]HIK78279.1 peptidylprolyl isomerase [Candidatus Poseidoniales archaeon]